MKGLGKASADFDCLRRVPDSASNPRFKELPDFGDKKGYKIASP